MIRGGIVLLAVVAAVVADGGEKKGMGMVAAFQECTKKLGELTTKEMMEIYQGTSEMTGKVLNAANCTVTKMMTTEDGKINFSVKCKKVSDEKKKQECEVCFNNAQTTWEGGEHSAGIRAAQQCMRSMKKKKDKKKPEEAPKQGQDEDKGPEEGKEKEE